MKTFNIVLWMPTVVHKDFNWLYKQETPVFEISDGIDGDSLNDGDARLYAKISVNPHKDLDIEVYGDQDGETVFKDECFCLVYTDHSHNGLFKYSLTIPDDGNALVKIEDSGMAVFPCDIYNRIKEFYHRHNYHAVNDGDSIIKPFVTTEDIDIKKDNNEALRHYLCQYEKKFSDSFSMLSNLYESLIQKKRWGIYLKLMVGKGKHGPFYQMSTAIKGDKTYCNTLLSSCYNRFTELRFSQDATEAEKTRALEEVKNAKRQRFNIENITNSVAIMVERVNNHFSLSTSFISFWLACFAILLSIVFFVITK